MRTGGLTFVALVAAFAQGATAGSADAATTSAAPQAAAVVNLANATRAQHGLRALHRSRTLDRSALLKAEDIRGCQSFSHTPCGAPFTRTFQQTGYFRGHVRIGENLYWGSGGLGTPDQAIAAWLRSPPHRANLLAGGWRDVGVGLVYSRSIFGTGNVWIFVLQFGRHG